MSMTEHAAPHASDLIRRQGGCHCGAVRFEILTGDRIEVEDCNCSICAKSGYLHLIVPSAHFRLLSDQTVLREYRFNTGAARHLFCSTCGVKSFYVPRSNPDGYSINLRCLDEPDAFTNICITAFNGRGDWETEAARLKSRTAPDTSRPAKT
jgi:hypothetical protein